MPTKIRAAIGAVALSVLGITMAAVPTHAFGSDEHDEITQTGLGFLHDPVVEYLKDQHDWSDADGPKFLPPYRVNWDELHFDDCDFDGATSYIRERFVGARSNLSRRNLWGVAHYFGRALHPAQDLYSHSNWVELGFPRTDNVETPRVEISQSDLMDISGAQRGLGTPWSVPPTGQAVRDDILLANDDLEIPLGWRIVRDGAGDFESTLQRPDGTVAGRLLETGKGARDAGCNVYSSTGRHKYSGFNHNGPDGLNKDDDNPSDDPTRLKYEKFLKARALAVLQTGYEWCRLVSEAAKADRDGMLLAMWVKPGANPHPRNTPCAYRQTVGRPHLITVTVESVQILDTGDPSNENGEIQLAAALYDDPQNFHRSVHGQSRTGEMSLETGQFVPRRKLPEAMTTCVRRNSQVNFALHGWDNDDGDLRYTYKHSFEYDGEVYTDGDELLVGGRAKFNSEASGTFTMDWEDLRVRFSVTQHNGSCL